MALDRRTFLTSGAGVAAAAWLGSTIEPAAADESISPLILHSPPATAYVDTLAVPPVLSGSGNLVMAAGTHAFHRDYPTSSTWGYGGQAYSGPTINAHQGQPLTFNVINRLPRHVLAANVDTSMEHVTTDDVAHPPTSMHLHGNYSRPEHDGHPMDTFGPGCMRPYTYPNREAARHLWYHDHAMGLTRLNVAGGLAGQYLVRDQYDTGTAANPLGLPSGDFEVPLMLQDRTFDSNGRLFYRWTPLFAANAWSSTYAGDRTLVNGTIWPRMPVARGVYRFRILNGSSARSYTLTLNGAAPMYVIGTEHGLLDAPLRVTSLRIASGERYDVLIDFSSLRSGAQVELRNTESADIINTVFGSPTIKQVMRFDVTASQGAVTTVPTTLRGGSRQPARLPAIPTATVKRVMNLGILLTLDRLLVGSVPIMFSLNNLGFDTTHVDIGKAGTTELWYIVNDTPVPHPIHVHMASMRLVRRQPFNNVLLDLFNPRPTFGTPYRPDPGPYLSPLGVSYASGYENAPKDVIIAEPLKVTIFTVTWPSIDQLGFDPDASYRSGALVSADPGSAQMYPMDDAETLRGYVWHCHFLDHEDHDMMLPIRFTA